MRILSYAAEFSTLKGIPVFHQLLPELKKIQLFEQLSLFLIVAWAGPACRPNSYQLFSRIFRICPKQWHVCFRNQGSSNCEACPRNSNARKPFAIKKARPKK